MWAGLLCSPEKSLVLVPTRTNGKPLVAVFFFLSGSAIAVHESIRVE